MELTQAMQILGIAEGQQISDEVAEAIRTVLAEMKQKPEKDVVEIVRCHDCKHDLTKMCMMVDGEAVPRVNDFCSYGERK